MIKAELMQILDSYLPSDAKIVIAENPKCLMGIDGNICIMIKLDGDWESLGEIP